MSQNNFYNRIRERATLREVLASPRSELIILYGRRGVGKSALLEQVLQEVNLTHIYYRATRRTMTLQLESLTEAAKDAFPEAFFGQPYTSFSTFLDFLSYLSEAREAANNREPVTVVIDELPYLADIDPGLLTTLQHWWDANKRRPNIKIFLSGSYVSFMERQVLDIQAPLYNRRTGAMQLNPMDYWDSSLFFPGYTTQEKMETYAILGGMPSYLEQFNPNMDIVTNLKNTALKQNTYLSEEPDWLLLEDLRRDVTYGSILRAVALGQRKPSDIAKTIGKKSAQDIGPSLEMLRGLGLLLREVPITDKRSPRSRNSLYYLADNYLDFWYRYIDSNRSLVARGLGEKIWERSIEQSLQHYVSKPAFERASREYLWRALTYNRLPAELLFTDIGAWWGAGDKEIDVIALGDNDKIVAAGSCKWTNAAMDVSDYAALQRDLIVAGQGIGQQIDNGMEKSPWLILFSKSGFTDRLQKIAATQKSQRLLLVDLEAMYAPG